MNNKTILFIGGHHSSAVPLLKYYKMQKVGVAFIGHKYASKLNNFVSSEYKEVNSLKVKYYNLDSPKFYNTPGLLKYLLLVKSIFKCVILLNKIKPSLVVSFGGYLAVPVVVASKLLFIKVITHEQTVTTGMANKVIAKMANKILVSFKESKSHFSSKKTSVVGIPLREEIKKVKIKQLGKNYNFKVLFVQGGKQGSHLLNSFVFKNIKKLTKKYVIYHQTAKHSQNNDHIIANKLSKKYKGKYYNFEYLYGDAYTKVLNKSDFTLSRSGAHTVYENSYLKMPSIFVPISFSIKNEQYKNAKIAKNYTPRVIVNEKDLNYDNFIKSTTLLKNSVKKYKNTNYNNISANAQKKFINEINKLINE